MTQNSRRPQTYFTGMIGFEIPNRSSGVLELSQNSLNVIFVWFLLYYISSSCLTIGVVLLSILTMKSHSGGRKVSISHFGHNITFSNIFIKIWKRQIHSYIVLVNLKFMYTDDLSLSLARRGKSNTHQLQQARWMDGWMEYLLKEQCPLLKYSSTGL